MITVLKILCLSQYICFSNEKRVYQSRQEQKLKLFAALLEFSRLMFPFNIADLTYTRFDK